MLTVNEARNMGMMDRRDGCDVESICEGIRTAYGVRVAKAYAQGAGL